jgi:peptidoglycan/LPS O-acetylase OafA/YrhL
MSDVATLAAATPSTRDRYVDFLRVASLGGVILGHFLMSVVEDRPEAVKDGVFDFTNILALEPWTRPGTWLLQVMPIFFVVGGFAHAVSWRSLTRRGGGYADFARARIGRLVTPALAFVAIGMAVGAVVEWRLGEHNDYAPVLQIAGQLLWFIGIYLIAAGLAPPMLRLHERFGWRTLVGLGAAAAAVDVLRLGLDVGGVRWLNFAFVWLFVHQLGFFYADGVADRLGARRLGGVMLGVGVTGTVVLMWLGPYGTAMVSYPGETLSNLTPPTVVLALFGVAQAGALLMMREPARRWLDRPRVWRAVIAGGALAMTAFLWHFTALILMYLGCHLVWPGRLPEPTTATWWWARIPQLVVFLVLVAVLVAAFRGFDRPPRRGDAVGGSWWRTTLAALGVACAILGMLGFAVVGFRGVLSGYVGHVAGVPMTAVAAFALALGAATLSWLAVRSGKPTPKA